MVTSRPDILIWENLQVWRFTPSRPASLRLSSEPPLPPTSYEASTPPPPAASSGGELSLEEPVGWLDGRGVGTGPPGENWGSRGMDVEFLLPLLFWKVLSTTLL